MLLAVLDKRAGLSQLAERDVYVSTVGGIKLTEPASDLAIALAIASAYKDVSIAHNLVAYGEISLAGEIRAVSASNQRANEATRLGFSTLIDASSGSMRDAVTEALTDQAQPRQLKPHAKSNPDLVP
jgi:DNA repair protein RadA/Sms